MQVVIIMHNTLTAIGLQQVISEGFGVSVHLADTIDDLLALPAESIDYVVTDAQYYVENLKYFLPRQSRTLVAMDNPAGDGTVNLLDTSLSSEQLMESLACYLGECDTPSTTSVLSQREIDVLRLVVSGCINKEIADRLNISINTVLTHRKNITAKLGIKSVSGLSFYAMMNGIIEPLSNS